MFNTFLVHRIYLTQGGGGEGREVVPVNTVIKTSGSRRTLVLHGVTSRF
jgi:hypothetical protein